MKLKSGSFFFLFVFISGWAGLTAKTVSAQIVWDKPKTEPPLANPYTIGVARDQIVKAASEIFKGCSIPVDTDRTSLADGRVVTKYEVFSKGITVRNDLEHVATPPASEIRNWTRARYYLEIIALPLDEKRSQLQVIAHIQGMVSDFSGSKWIDVPSNGSLEDDVLRGLSSKILGIDLNVKTSSGRSGRRIFNCEY
jgi:hypothetical protein